MISQKKELYLPDQRQVTRHKGRAAAGSGTPQIRFVDNLAFENRNHRFSVVRQNQTDRLFRTHSFAII